MTRIPSRTSREVAEKYEKERNTFKKGVVSDVRRKIDIEIGDIKEDNFYPQFKTKHWDNECNFSARYITDYTKGVVRTEGNKVKWVEDTQEVHLYDLDIDEDGGFEIEILLKEKPKTNKFVFSIQTKGLDFFYQPALTKEEKGAPRGEGGGSHRPDKVIGSYAVYHKEKKGNYSKGNDYKTGKAFHIYRPHIVDADGKETWGKININEKKGLLTVTVPQKFLESASYPVLVDPTFGYTSIGGSTSYTGNDAYFTTDTPSSSGTVDSITVYADLFSGSTSVKPVIWDDSSTNVITDGIAPLITVNTSAAKWWTSTYSTNPSITGSTAYNVGIIADNAQTDFFYDTGASGSGGVDTSNSYASPQSLDTKSSTTRKYSVYATYTESSSPRRVFNIS